MHKWDCESLLLLKDRGGDSRLRLKDGFGALGLEFLSFDLAKGFTINNNIYAPGW